MAEERLYRNQCEELFTEYPFFRDGMTIEEFQKEQQAYFEYLAAGGKYNEYKPKNIKAK